MKKVFLLIFFISITSYAQKNINNYKYVVVPKQFDFFKQADKYQTSSLTKFLFNKNGFTTLLDDETYPQDLADNGCLALKAHVSNTSGIFSTKIIIELRDCNNRVVFKSVEGRSNIKEYKKAYHEAIRKAFNSIKALKYSYRAPVRTETVTQQSTASISNQVVNELPQNTTPVTRPVIENNSVVNELPRNNRVGVSKRASVFRMADVSRTGNVNERTITRNNRVPFLYAKRINNGFQILNVKQEFMFTVLATNLRNVFIIKNKNGVLYKENNNWVADFYDITGNKVSRQYDIRLLRPTRTRR